MSIECGKIEGPLEVRDDFQLDGMVTGDVVVADGGHFILRGMCCQNLIVLQGGTVELFGTVSGSVINRGGFLEVHGTIGGRLETVEGGDTYVDENAQVGGTSG